MSGAVATSQRNRPQSLVAGHGTPCTLLGSSSKDANLLVLDWFLARWLRVLFESQITAVNRRIAIHGLCIMGLLSMGDLCYIAAIIAHVCAPITCSSVRTKTTSPTPSEKVIILVASGRGGRSFGQRRSARFGRSPTFLRTA